MNTLIKNKYVEGKVGIKSQVSKFFDVQEYLSGELEKIRVVVVTHDSDITQLRARVQ